MADDFDEVAFNVLLTETDPATASVASIRDPQPQHPTTRRSNRIVLAGIITGLIVAVLIRWLL